MRFCIYSYMHIRTHCNPFNSARPFDSPRFRQSFQLFFSEFQMLISWDPMQPLFKYYPKISLLTLIFVPQVRNHSEDNCGPYFIFIMPSKTHSAYQHLGARLIYSLHRQPAKLFPEKCLRFESTFIISLALKGVLCSVKLDPCVHRLKICFYTW